MLSILDSFINRFTMYRITLYGLLAIAGLSILFGFLGWISLSPFALIASLVVALIACEASNRLFAKFVHAMPSLESSTITALILFFLMRPASTLANAGLLALTCVIAMGSKYFFVINKRHVFNPAAMGAFLIGLTGLYSAVWWVGTPVFLPFMVLLVLVMVRKIRRFSLFLTGIICALASAFFFAGSLSVVPELFLSWPLLFFCGVMLTEPATAPPIRSSQIGYAALAGFLFGSPIHIGHLAMTPQFALLIGNVYAICVSPKWRYQIRLLTKTLVGRDVYHFAFEMPEPVSFTPGQYMEWTLAHPHTDTRGNRRYFTVASSPTEAGLAIGVKIVPDQSSSFKRQLLQLEPGDTMSVGQLAGDFTLPEQKTIKLLFVAGGIGVTPFRSMVRAILDRDEKRDVILVYACTTATDFAYNELWKEAADRIGLRLVCVASKPLDPTKWTGATGYITEELITREVSDLAERKIYISGPNMMVQMNRKVFRNLGVPRRQIKTDYFPGF